MQSPGGEGQGEETLSPEGRDSEQQDGEDKAAEDCGVNVSPATEVREKAESCYFFAYVVHMFTFYSGNRDICFIFCPGILTKEFKPIIVLHTLLVLWDNNC